MKEKKATVCKIKKLDNRNDEAIVFRDTCREVDVKEDGED